MTQNAIHKIVYCSNKLKSNMSAGKFYSYNWTENPSLGTISTSCKVASQTYTYPAGYGN